MFKFNLKKVKAFIFALPLAIVFMSQTAFAANYTVVKGDSLYKIGTTFGTTAEYLKQSNNLSGNTIYPGQVLNVPAVVYTVRSGDTLYLIAKNNNVTLSALRAANNKWDDMIYPGQTLLIPKTSGSTTSQNAQNNSAVISYTAYELDLLARLIEAEAAGQSYTAKVAVGAVVVNRVQDSRFPNTITDVIYQVDHGYYQFTPVVNGWINKPASQESKNAAYAALHGSDPTNGAVYYFDDSTKNTWLWSKPIALRSGNMVYTY